MMKYSKSYRNWFIKSTFTSWYQLKWKDKCWCFHNRWSRFGDTGFVAMNTRVTLLLPQMWIKVTNSRVQRVLEPLGHSHSQIVGLIRVKLFFFIDMNLSNFSPIIYKETIWYCKIYFSNIPLREYLVLF